MNHDDDDMDHDLRGTPYWDDECEQQWQDELQRKREQRQEKQDNEEDRIYNDFGDFLGVNFKYVAGDPFW